MSQDNPAAWQDEPVWLAPHDPGWAARFEDEAKVIRRVIGDWITDGVHHAGSTAVPGVEAKPVIDIAVGVASLEASRPCIEILRRIDYLYSPYRADEMHWFCKPDPARRTHHLHLIPSGSRRFADELAFRDFLRDHSDCAAEYAALKRRLVIDFAEDREAYTRGKSDFVQMLTERAHRWASGS